MNNNNKKKKKKKMDDILSVLTSSLQNSSKNTKDTKNTIDNSSSSSSSVDLGIQLKQAAVLVLFLTTENCQLSDFSSFPDVFDLDLDLNLDSDADLDERNLYSDSNYFHDDIFILLTKRPSHMRAHPGEVCFPGGKKDDTDEDLIYTALREAEEECGILREDVNIIGSMSSNVSVHMLQVTPIVAELNVAQILHRHQNNVHRKKLKRNSTDEVEAKEREKSKCNHAKKPDREEEEEGYDGIKDSNKNDLKYVQQGYGFARSQKIKCLHNFLEKYYFKLNEDEVGKTIFLPLSAILLSSESLSSSCFNYDIGGNGDVLTAIPGTSNSSSTSIARTTTTSTGASSSSNVKVDCNYTTSKVEKTTLTNIRRQILGKSQNIRCQSEEFFIKYSFQDMDWIRPWRMHSFLFNEKRYYNFLDTKDKGRNVYETNSLKVGKKRKDRKIDLKIYEENVFGLTAEFLIRLAHIFVEGNQKQNMSNDLSLRSQSLTGKFLLSKYIASKKLPYETMEFHPDGIHIHEWFQEAISLDTFKDHVEQMYNRRLNANTTRKKKGI